MLTEFADSSGDRRIVSFQCIDAIQAVRCAPLAEPPAADTAITTSRVGPGLALPRAPSSRNVRTGPTWQHQSPMHKCLRAPFPRHLALARQRTRVAAFPVASPAGLQRRPGLRPALEAAALGPGGLPGRARAPVRAARVQQRQQLAGHLTRVTRPRRPAAPAPGAGPRPAPGEPAAWLGRTAGGGGGRAAGGGWGGRSRAQHGRSRAEGRGRGACSAGCLGRRALGRGALPGGRGRGPSCVTSPSLMYCN